jgi:hypothetical protein
MPRYSDAFLLQVLEKSVRRINRELCLTGTDEELSVDTSGTVSPANSDLEDVVLLQAECMILNIDMNNDFNSSADGEGNGYFVKDGEQSLDTRGEVASRATARTGYMNSKYNPCAELERALVKEKLKRSCDMRDIW